MKIRNGFVSNSSSSSFVITCSDFNEIKCPSCKQLLKIYFKKMNARHIILADDYYKDDINNYFAEYEDFEHKPMLYDFAKRNRNIMYYECELDDAEFIENALKAIKVNYLVEEH